MTDAAADSGSVAPSSAAPRFHPAYAIAGAIALVAAVAAYGAWRFHQDFQTRLDAITASLDAANAERQRLAGALDTLRRDAADQAGAAARAEAERKALATQLTTLKDAAGRGAPTFDATIAEAEYLAFLAAQRLSADYDPAGAVAALDSADALLATANRPELAGVREQIARDREALGRVDVPDVRELALELTRAEHAIDGLPLREVGTAPLAAPEAPGRPTGWRGVLDGMWHDLLSLVEVRDAAPGDALLLDPARRALLRQDLRQELAVAKYAALRRDTGEFRAAAGVVLAALKTGFATGDAAVAALMSRLEDARKLELAPALPVPGSLAALRARAAAAATPEGTGR
ncbi:MAG: uroporphyrinogen-III C-methyltransferase [Gammaproteobacteria bacterium]|nr:uroporphyrinogen-III C-methyltransferase [Gammaproteobacteria bacterium]MBI5616538.1 uroporphyrinogen-III C-methyltransferase [Gammaproteobacteria bacterium]